MPKQWKCTVCGYIHEGKTPPDVCPVCGAIKYQFILYEDLPKDLEKRLREAFAGESKAYVRNTAFAHQAEKEGYPQIARLFRAVAEAEKVHAEEYLKYLEGMVGKTEDNLKAAFENEPPGQGRVLPGIHQRGLCLQTGGCSLELYSFPRCGGTTCRIIQRRTDGHVVGQSLPLLRLPGLRLCF